jgi:hypothetical protein
MTRRKEGMGCALSIPYNHDMLWPCDAASKMDLFIDN